MRAWNPAEDERRRREANNLGIMFLGPVFGAPAALARMAGAPEPVVESMGQLGLDMAGVAGVPGARGGGRVIEPVPMRPVATMPYNTGRVGVVILRKPPSWSIPSAVREKIPKAWGESKANNKGVGERWQDPNNKGNGVRIDQGDPANSQPTQQIDHVVVRSGGKVIGRDGFPITGSIRQNFDKAHIPLSEYSKWPKWNSPN